jgi:hypothetical protein
MNKAAVAFELVKVAKSLLAVDPDSNLGMTLAKAVNRVDVLSSKALKMLLSQGKTNPVRFAELSLAEDEIMAVTRRFNLLVQDAGYEQGKFGSGSLKVSERDAFNIVRESENAIHKLQDIQRRYRLV